MNTTFIHIGEHYLNVAHIIDVVVDGHSVDIITANTVITCAIGTPEATAIIGWLDRQSEGLVGDDTIDELKSRIHDLEEKLKLVDSTTQLLLCDAGY
jgi:hypothetical protein